MRNCEMYDLRANEDYQCVFRGSGTKLYLRLVLVENKRQPDEKAGCTQQNNQKKQRVRERLFEGLLFLLGMAIGISLYVLASWIPVLF